MAGLKVSAIQRAYHLLWNGFTAAAAGQALNTHINAPGGVVDNATSTQGPRVTSLIYLPGWPYKSVSDHKTLDVVIRVYEEFALSTPELVKSTTQIGYFQKTQGNKKSPILQMHYDYEHQVGIAHPVFHAQLGKTNWPMSELKEMGFSDVSEPAQEYFKAARIPTAFMGFGQILLMLAADHLSVDNYATVLKTVRESESAQWSAVCPSLKTSLGAGGYLHSHHWYCAPEEQALAGAVRPSSSAGGRVGGGQRRPKVR